MALPSKTKKQILEAIALGKTDSEIAREIGCARLTVKRTRDRNQSTIQAVKAIAAEKLIEESSDAIVAGIKGLRDREPRIQEALWSIFEGLNNLFKDALSAAEPTLIEPRHLPALAKSAADIAIAYADYSDRVNGLDVLSDEIQKINESRQAKKPEANA